MPLACGRARVGADARASRMRRQRTHGRGTGTIGTGRTDVAHGTVSTRRMGRGQERRSWWYLGWSGTRRGRRVLRGVIVTERPSEPRGYCSDATVARRHFSPVLRIEMNPAQLKYQAQGS